MAFCGCTQATEVMVRSPTCLASRMRVKPKSANGATERKAPDEAKG